MSCSPRYRTYYRITASLIPPVLTKHPRPQLPGCPNTLCAGRVEPSPSPRHSSPCSTPVPRSPPRPSVESPCAEAWDPLQSQFPQCANRDDRCALPATESGATRLSHGRGCFADTTSPTRYNIASCRPCALLCGASSALSIPQDTESCSHPALLDRDLPHQ